MTTHATDRFEISREVGATALWPHDHAAGPLILFLYGGGGDAETLFSLEPVLAGLPAAVACANVPPYCFYLDRWAQVVSHDLVAAVTTRWRPPSAIGLVGVSMGGYGALRIALDAPRRVGAVAAVAPMIEPRLDAASTPLRNRYHYPPEVPDALRTAETPAQRAIRRSPELADLPIYLDAGSRDALFAHDGAEHLHRVLWDLDIPHRYVLHRDAGHTDASLGDRLGDAFRWVCRHLTEGPPTGVDGALRAQLAPARDRARALDPTVERVYGPID